MACELARRVFAADPQQGELVWQVVGQALRNAADAGEVEAAAELFRELQACPHHPTNRESRLLELAARQGEWTPALLDHRSALGHFVDHVVQHRKPELLPESMQADYRTIVNAFRAATKSTNPAPATLETISVRSPFLEWKVLFRALLAYSSRDAEKVAACQQRMAPDRLPATLLTMVLQQPEKNALQDALLALRQDINSPRGLQTAFAMGRKILAMPDLPTGEFREKLARLFYRAVAHHGQPDDLKRYSSCFGPPSDDPNFSRLSAIALEESGDWLRALENWQAYEQWLAQGKVHWPSDVTRRVRAKLHLQMAQLLRRFVDYSQELDIETFLRFDMHRRLSELLGPSLSGDSFLKHSLGRIQKFLEKARDLDPTWDEASRALTEHYVQTQNLAAAQAEADRILTHNPKCLPVLLILAKAYRENQQPSLALEVWERIRACNLLAPKHRKEAALCAMLAARQELAKKSPASAERFLERQRDFEATTTQRASYWAIVTVLRTAQKRFDEAAQARQKANESSEHPVVAATCLVIESTIAGIRPALRKPWEAELASHLTAPPTLPMIQALLKCLNKYAVHQIEYRGRAALERKVTALAIDGVSQTLPMESLEEFSQWLVTIRDGKTAAKIVNTLVTRYSTNPVFLLTLAQVELIQKNRVTQKINRALNKCLSLIERSKESRHKILLDQVSALIDEFRPY
jgi:tetratricopeptide (TPR) repeat protein